MGWILRTAIAAAGAVVLAMSAQAQTAAPSDKVIITGADKDRFSFYFRTRQNAIDDLYRRIHAACTVFDTAGLQVLDAQKRAKPVSVSDQEKTGAACAEILFTHLVGNAEAIKAGRTDAGVKIDGMIPFWVTGFEYPASNRAADVKVHFRQAHGDGRRYAKTIDELVAPVVVRTSSSGSAKSSVGPVQSSGGFESDDYPYYGVVWPDLCDRLHAGAAWGYCGNFRTAHLRWRDVINDADLRRGGQFDPALAASGRME
jgi:hypothetical protein